jgi:ABC-type glycerol-3-phosphate transport system substrate-binding protein
MFSSKVFSAHSAQISLSLTLLFLFGCSEPKEPSPAATQTTSAPSAPVKLTVLVAGDEQLAEGVHLLRGEWKAHGGGELDVEAVDLKSFPGASEIAADVVLFPSRLLGALVEKKQLRPVRSSLLENPQFALHEIFPALRNGEMKYGGETWALPLGSPPLFMFLQTDATDENKPAKLPQTWEQFRKWLNVGAADAKRPAAPLAGRAAACLLIARALAYTEVQHRHEALFDPSTMKPRITDAPFVRALSELLEEAGGDASHAPADFAAAVTAVHQGQAAAAFGWPGLLHDAKSTAASATSQTVLAPLPVSEQVYHSSDDRWEAQIFRQPITLLGVEGRLVAVTASSRNAVSAFQLAQWLTTGDPAVQLSSRSYGALWFRSSQTSAHARWLKGEVISATQSSIAELVRTALSNESPLIIPRIPAIDEYLSVLGDAIHSAKPGEAGAQAALISAAAQWEAKTDRLGRQQQAAAYRRHLGIESFQDAKP